ncbi:MAG: acetate kinase [Eubacteriales bacterium]|nr:acetate kinase [Eubacteriales bacterium]
MKILVINCGSSSLKYQLFDMTNETVLGKGIVERIGIEGSFLNQNVNGEKYLVEAEMKDHKAAMKHVFEALLHPEKGLISSLDEINAIGHRVLHGGEELTDSIIIDEHVKEVVREYVKFGPLHNPANLMGIEACEALVPGKPNVAVFDTSFHQTMPASSYMYGIPYEYYEKYRIRKFGFHGTSHKYITRRTAEILNKPLNEVNIITVHLGNGSSLAAVKDGKCLDTSMGLTPLEGLVMGTRCGDLDPTVLTFLIEEEGIKPSDLNQMLNKKSGFLGISGLSSDARDLEAAAEAGNERAQLALDMFVNRCQRYLGGYMLELKKVDAICFAGGIGENSPEMRERLLGGLEFFGIQLDEEANKVRGKETKISTEDSKVQVWVVPTNEELMIARDTLDLVK